MAVQPQEKRIAARDTHEERRRGFRRAIDRRSAAIEALGEWITDQQPYAVILVDAGLTPYFLNRAAREALKRIEWIRLGQRQLEVLDPGLGSELRSVLAAWPKPKDSRIRVSKGTRTLDVAALKVRPPLRDVYAITMASPAVKMVNRGLLMKAFGLTSAEAQVAALIHEGWNRVSVAKRRGSSINTVRAQMKNIFKKLAVRSQLQLVKKISEWAAGG